jgi:translation initiation factor 1
MDDKKDKNNGIVFSTNPDFNYQGNEKKAAETLSPEKQKLKIRLDKKHRAGKAVTLIVGFVGRIEDLEELGRKLKNICGTGGSAKEGEIIIQGDQREKVFQWLVKNGYTNTSS